MATELFVNPSLGPEHFETVLDSVPEAVLAMNRDFVITCFNRAAERVTGFRRTEVVGRHCYEICRSSACRSATACPLTIALHTGAAPRAPRDVCVLNRHNQKTPVRVRFTPLRNLDGDIVGGVETFHLMTDISAQDGNDGVFSILEATERRAIEDVLARHNWNRTTAAAELGISRITLWRKMRKLNIGPHH